VEARHLVITGLVQGIGFRYHMVNAALRLGIKGWVRNRRDGSVEAVIAGNPETIAAMIHWARSGPPAARVDQIHVEQLDTTPPLEGFSQQPTE
jgi:acylphosphatase